MDRSTSWLYNAETPEQFGSDIAQDPRQQFLNWLIENAKKVPTSLPPAPPDPGPEELGRQLDERSPLNLLFGGQKKMPAMSYRPNPALESQIQAEAKGLMADEAGRTIAAPNVPRDPEREKLLRHFKQMGGGPAYGYPGAKNLAPPLVLSDRRPHADLQFADEDLPLASPSLASTPRPGGARPVPDSTAYAAQNPVRGREPSNPMDELNWMGSFKAGPDAGYETVQDEGGHVASHMTTDEIQPEGAPTMERAGKVVPVDRPSDTPASQLSGDPFRDLLLQKLRQGPGSDKGAVQADESTRRMVGDLNGANTKFGLMALLAKSAAQMGSTGGKIADTSGVDGYFKGIQEGNTNQIENLYKISQAQAKRSATAKDNTQKTLVDMIKLAQQEKLKNAELEVRKAQLKDNEDYKRAMLDATAGKNEGELKYKNDLLDLKKQLQDPNRPLTKKEQKQLDLIDAQIKKLEKPSATDQTEGEKVTDRKFADIYTNWSTNGGRSVIQGNIKRLRNVANTLRTSSDTGPFIGSGALGMETFRTLTGNKADSMEKEVQSAIQDSFKDIYGAQFTDAEGRRLLQAAFDKTKSPQENLKRVNAIIKQMEDKTRITDEAVSYYEKNRKSLTGYSGGSRQISSTPAPGQVPEGTIRIQKGNKFIMQNGKWTYVKE